MTIPKINSAHGSDTRNILNRAIDLINAQGKSIQDLVAKGQLTPAQYAELVRVVNGNIKHGEVSVHDIDVNKGKITQNMISTELLEAIAGDAPVSSEVADGSVTKVKVAPKAIDATRTNFAGKGKNLWDGSFETGIALGGSPATGGSIVESANGVMAFIEVEPNSTVTIWTNGDTDKFRIATSGKRLGIGESVSRYLYFYDTATKNEATVTLSANERFIVVYLSSEGKIPTELQVEKGNSRTTYESPENVSIKFAEKSIPKNALDDDVLKNLDGSNITDKAITPDKTTFAKKGKNLFSGKFVKDVALMGSTSENGSLITGPVNDRLSVIERIEPNTTYTASSLSGSSNRFRVATFTKYPENGDKVSRWITTNDAGAVATFTSNSNENYVVITVSSSEGYKEPKEFMIEKGSSKTEYESENAVVIELSGLNKESENVNISNKKINLTHVLQSNYDAQSEYISPYTNDVNFLYGLYDESVSAHPDYVTKTVIGHEPTGLPIHQYDFKPPEPKYAAGVSGEYKKIIVVSSIHGMEKHAAVGTAKFFKALCDDWRNDSVLELLRWNIHFVVIPSLNPWGYNANERKNSNGVDLNRNFPTGWRTGNDPSARDYPGPSPASEIETQLMQQVIENNKDAVFMFDHHNAGGWDFNRYVVWTASNDSRIRGMLNSFNHFIAAQMKRKFSYFPENESLQYLSEPVAGGLARHAYGEGIDSALLESSLGLSTEHETQILNENTVGNLLVSVVKNYS